MKKYLIKGSIIHALLVWAALALGYNSYKEYMSHVDPLTRTLRDSIQSAFPWALLIFSALYIVFFIKQKTIKIFFPMRQYIYILLIYAVLLNLILFIKGKDLLIPLNLSMLYFIALLNTLRGLNKVWQISYTKAQKLFPTIFQGNTMLFNVFTLSLTLLISLTIGEVSLRYQYKKEHDVLISKNKDRELCTTYSADPGLIYTFIPNKCESNSHGYRDYEYSYRKENGSFRIIVIGDSVAQGQEVMLRESFGKVLETKLNQSAEDRKFEVIVLARTGYSTSQEIILLGNEAFNYQPDLIVWSYMLNDPAHPVYHGANGELGRYYYKPKLHFLDFVQKKIFKLKEKIKGKNCEKEFHKLLHCAYWDQVEANIHQIGSISKSKKIPVIFLIHPIFEKDSNFNTYTLTPMHKKLYDAASESGFMAVDLLNAFKPYDMDEVKTHSETWYDPWHPNAKGHMIIAEYIYKYIVENGYLAKKKR